MLKNKKDLVNDFAGNGNANEQKCGAKNAVSNMVSKLKKTYKSMLNEDGYLYFPGSKSDDFESALRTTAVSFTGALGYAVAGGGAGVVVVAGATIHDGAVAVKKAIAKRKDR